MDICMRCNQKNYNQSKSLWRFCKDCMHHIHSQNYIEAYILLSIKYKRVVEQLSQYTKRTYIFISHNNNKYYWSELYHYGMKCKLKSFNKFYTLPLLANYIINNSEYQNLRRNKCRNLYMYLLYYIMCSYLLKLDKVYKQFSQL